jgi:putative transposase
MEDDPAQYHWSSCSGKVQGFPVPWLDLDPFYLSLGKSAGKRAKKYALWLQESIPESELKLIRDAIQQGRLTASDNFIRQMADTVGHCLEVRKPGRPRKDEK